MMETQRGVFMPKSQNQKLRLPYLMKLLLEQTDEEHPMTISQMTASLEKLGIRASRKTLYDDIEDLRRFGVDIACCKSRTTSYFVANRTFELPELKVLADAVASSKFLTEKKSAHLIGKIESLASKPEAQALQRQVFVRGRVKTQNEQIYYNVDTIHQAIAMDRPVAFRYFEYCVDWNAPSHWTKRFRRDGEKYTAYPYALTWDNENYYMVAYYEKYGGFSNFRVDKMERIEILGAGEMEKPDGLKFEASEYAKKVFGMFSGREERITLRFDESLIGVVLDRFGKDVTIRRADGGGFLINAEVVVGPTLLSWIFEFGGRVKIIEPESLVAELRRMARESLSQYSG
jgi:predicted DNA-binding transcriptional regulator YafY